MGSTGLALVVSISELVMKYGVPAALQIMKDWDKEDPSFADIMELKTRVPKPDSYFTKDDTSN